MPTRPSLARKAKSSSPRIAIFLGGPSRSGSSSDNNAGIQLVESVQLFSHLANIGDTRSLILHPASTTHRQLTDEQRLSAGAGPDVLRLSIGIETVDDIIADLKQALARATS